MKITIDRSVVEQALEALFNSREFAAIYGTPRAATVEAQCHESITALRAALAEPVHIREHCLWARNGNEPCPHVQQAQPVQEPVAKCIDDICSEHLGRVEAFDHLPRGTLLYTAPPHRRPLTDEQKQTIHNETGAGHSLICLVESYINGIKE